MDNNAIDLGKRIHALRSAQGLSLRDLAHSSGLTASFLSQVERGLVNSSIESLRRITNGLGISLVHLFEGDPAPASPPAHENGHTMRAGSGHSPVIVRADSRPKLLLPMTGVTIEMLTSNRAAKAELFVSHLEPGASIIAQPLREPTEQFVFVLGGSLRIDFAHASSVLACGDAIYYDGATVRLFACVGECTTSWICMITPPVF
jgi:transcriptional regulator with XRE-family HTH domain